MIAFSEDTLTLRLFPTRGVEDEEIEAEFYMRYVRPYDREEIEIGAYWNVTIIEDGLAVWPRRFPNFTPEQIRQAKIAAVEMKAIFDAA